MIARFDIALNALSVAKSNAVATPIKIQDWGSHKASNLGIEPNLVPGVRGVASHDHGRGIHELLKSRSHGRAEAVCSSAAFRTHWFNFCKRKEYEGAQRAQRNWRCDRILEHSLQCALFMLLVWGRHGCDDSKNSTV